MLINGATLNVVSPASITGNINDMNNDPAISGYGDTTINLTGGQVTGITYSGPYNSVRDDNGVGIVSDGGSLIASGGVVQGGSITDALGQPEGFPALGVYGPSAQAQISGGTFQGGNGYEGGLKVQDSKPRQ